MNLKGTNRVTVDTSAGRASHRRAITHLNQASSQSVLGQRAIQPYLHILLGGIVDLRWTPEDISCNDCAVDGFA